MRVINTYKESTTTLVKDLHQRQKLHVNEWNQILHVESNELDIERASFSDDMPLALIEASTIACYRSCMTFKIRF